MMFEIQICDDVKFHKTYSKLRHIEHKEDINISQWIYATLTEKRPLRPLCAVHTTTKRPSMH